MKQESSALKISAMQHRVTVRHAFENSKFLPVFYPTMKSRGDASGGSAVAKSVICRTTGWRARRVASRRVGSGEIFNSLRGDAEETPSLIFFHEAITPAHNGCVEMRKSDDEKISSNGNEYFLLAEKKKIFIEFRLSNIDSNRKDKIERVNIFLIVGDTRCSKASKA